jgi:hypothetical protein
MAMRWASHCLEKLFLNFIQPKRCSKLPIKMVRSIAINGISPDMAKDIERQGGKVYSASLPRVFGVFFNQNENPVLAEAIEVRQALDLSRSIATILSTPSFKALVRLLTGPVPRTLYRRILHRQQSTL